MHLIGEVRRRQLVAPIVLAATAFLLAFWQRPSQQWADTRIELLTDPSLFLSRVAQAWTPTIDLGHVQPSQFVGYLFPMGPFFAGGEALGLPMWIVQRLWIALLLALAAWGVAKLIAEFRPASGTSPALIAGLIYLASPYVMITLARGTVWLLPYATLPWLLIATRRGVKNPKGWMAPAAIALLVSASGGGINAAIVAWIIAAAALLAIFEGLTGTSWKAISSWAWRTTLLATLASLWWLIPVLVQVRFGAEYLTFTEHAESILNTPSASESLRLLGYWIGYINGYPDERPQIPAMESYLLSAPVIIATFLVPAIAIATVAASRKWKYAAFFGLLLALSIFVMSAGFPPESRVGQVVVDLYYQSGPLQFIRTTYKASPLAAVSIAALAGTGLGVLFQRIRATTLTLEGRRLSTIPMTVVGILLVGIVIGLWGRPLWSGGAVDRRLFFEEVPSAWVDAVADAQKTTPRDTRIAVLPGELFAWYRWAGTQNSVVPALSDRPVIVRQILRPASDQAAQLLDSVDSLVQQGRLTPNQLPPLLQLMGVGRVLVGSDSSPQRNEALDAARAQFFLSQQPGFGRPAAEFGPKADFSPPPDRSGPTARLAQVRAYAAPRPPEPRITRIQPIAEASIVDGDADGVIAMAAVGALNPDRASFYAGDLDRRSFGRLLQDTPTLTFTDSNRRRYILSSKIVSATSQTLPADQEIDRIFPSYDPFPQPGSTGRTVAVYRGVSSLTSPAAPGFTVFPEHRPYAAFDGRNDTSWIAESDEPADRYLDLVLARPVTTPWIWVRPHVDRTSQVTQVDVSVNGGAYRSYKVKPGFNRIPVGISPIGSLRIRVGSRRNIYGLAPAGLDEVKIPGVRITEALKLPTTLSSLASGEDLSRSPMRIIVERTTADFPRRAGQAVAPRYMLDPTQAVDAENGIARILTLPAAREYRASGWASVRPGARDDLLDELAAMPGESRYMSSSRFEGLAGYRASSAFDRDRRTAWAAEYDGNNHPWVEWRGPDSITLSKLRLRSGPGNFLPVTRVSVGTENGGFEAPVAPDGTVRLPGAITGRSVRVEVVRVRSVPRTPSRKQVPIAVSLSEVEIEGVPVARPQRSGDFESACGALTISDGPERIAMRVAGSIRAMDTGESLAVSTCGDSLRIPAGTSTLVSRSGKVFAPDQLRLDGPPPKEPLPVVDPPRIGPDGKIQGAGPAWLVLANSYSDGWRATCTDPNGNRYGLGAPERIDGFANGWRIDGSRCVRAAFSFGPQRIVNAGYAISAITTILILVLLFLGLRSRRRHEGVVSASTPDAELLIVSGGTSLRAAGTTRPPRAVERVSFWLIGASSACVALVGVLYVSNPDPGREGINFDYALHQQTAHWVAVLAMLLLGAGVVLRIWQHARGAVQPPPTGESAEASDVTSA